MTEQEEFEFRHRLEQEQGSGGKASGPTARQRLASQYYHSGEQKSLSDLIAPDRFKTNVADLPWYTQALGGAKSAWDRAAMGLKGVFTDLTPEDRALLEQGRAFQDEGGAPATIGSIGADVAMSAGPAALGKAALPLAAKYLPAAANVVSKSPVLARTAASLGYGAGYGALTSPEDRAGGAIGGAIGTGVGLGINRLAGGLIKPFVTKDAQALMDQGIQPTIGQAMGGAVNQTEQKLKSLPIAGDLIRNARNRAVNEFNEKAIQVANPASKGFGDEALTATREALGNKYDEILGSLPKITLENGPIMASAKSAANDAALGLSKDSKAFINDYVQRHMLSRGQSMTGDVAKRVESDLLKVIQSKRASQDGEQRAIGDALSKVHEAWRDSLASAAEAVNPGAGSALLENNRAWRAFVALDRAGSYRGNQNIASNEIAGKFTPNSLRRSIEASDQSQFNNATRGMDFRTPKAAPNAPASVTQPSSVGSFGMGPIIPEHPELGLSQGRLGYDLPQIGRNGPVLAPNDIPNKSITDWLRMRMGGGRGGAAAEAAAMPSVAKPGVTGESPFNRLSRLTRQGERVLGDSVPDSGTAGRLGMMEILKYGGAAGAGGAAAYADPGTALGTAALLAAPYSRAGSKFAMQGVMPLYEAAVKQLSLRGVPTKTIDEALRKYGPQGVISLARGGGVNSQ